MKSSVLIILSLLLATAILAPSVITLTNLVDKTAITFDFNEEEKKEEKKEVDEKDFFLYLNLNSLVGLQDENVLISSFYFQSDYPTSLGIFLPPPEHSL